MQRSPEAVVNAYFDGVNEERYADVGALFAPEGELRPPGRRRYRGPDEVAGYLGSAIAPYVTHDDRLLRLVVDGRTAVAEIRFEGVRESGREIDFDAVDVFDFDEEGRITLVTTWCDTHRLRQLVAGDPGVGAAAGSDSGGRGAESA